MPLVKIERLRIEGACAKGALFDAVHAALVTVFKIPDHDRTQRFVEYEHGDFELPPGHSDRLTLIEITAFSGRTLDTKRALYRDLVNRLEKLGIPPHDIFIVLHEVPTENWGMRGGLAGCDIDFGFKIRV